MYYKFIKFIIDCFERSVYVSDVSKIVSRIMSKNLVTNGGKSL